MMFDMLEHYQRADASSSVSPTTTDNNSMELPSINSPGRIERESIHSGQFMVSHFEAEEAQDDLDDGEIKMLDPEDPSLVKPDEPNTCTELKLYVPHKVVKLQPDGSGCATRLVTSQLEIETSLTKLFKCMSLAYSQKLTSPKWNHFKGVRLRWKDKIRLNNVIWRCWHMQFILKLKTPVCQFASPLDVDIHSNPQSVVLEGKYWKRQVVVIKAEYRKWRRNFKTKAIGSLVYDNKSEIDFLEWSPLNDKSLMLSEDWTTDTLFSSINGPFPFPDQREIARGAGIADFIQPSLGPLQPNLDDFDLIELLRNPTGLAPVPEEGADDMLKNVDYSFPAITGPEQIDASNVMDVGPSNVNQLQNDTDANMLELNTPLNNVAYADIEQQFTTRTSANVGMLGSPQTTTSHEINTPNNALMSDARGVAVFLTDNTGPNHRNSGKLYGAGGENMMSRPANEFLGKSVIKGRIAKTLHRPFRREPHNYDKAQPTLHQTTIHHIVMAEQKVQQQQMHPQHLQPNLGNFGLQHPTTSYPTAAGPQQQPQQQLQYSATQYAQPASTNIMSAANNNYVYNSNLSLSAANLNATPANLNSNLLSKPFGSNQHTNVAVTQSLSAPTLPAQAQSLMPNVKIEPPSSDVLSMFNLSTATGTNDFYQNNTSTAASSASTSSNSYKPYPSVPPFKKSASAGAYLNARGQSGIEGSGVGNQSYLQQDIMQTSPHMHTHSLPLNINGNLLNSIQQQQHQHQQQQQQVQLHANPLSSPTSSSQQQQQHQPHQPTHQTSLPTPHLLQHHATQPHLTTQSAPAQLGVMPKEMFRSNSLPLSVTFQKKDSFAMPKHHVKSSNKTRSRSNSIHQQHSVMTLNSNASASAMNAVGGGMQVAQQLQTATSDPILNSTLAQLLTTKAHMPIQASKQQSSSTSAISSLSVPMSTDDNNEVLPISNAAVKPVSMQDILQQRFQMQQQQQQLQKQLQRQQQQQQQQHTQPPPHKSPKKSSSLPPPTTTQLLHSPPSSKMLSYPPTAAAVAAAAAAANAGQSTHLSLSPESFHDQDSPLSPTYNLVVPRDNQRRAGHLHAEQKRRYNIKNGFDALHKLIPELQKNPNAKLSKAAMLQKGADFIKQLHFERNQLEDNMKQLRKERDNLNNSLMHLHSILPANGAPVTRQGTEHVRQLYEQYVEYRTISNWKFWILGLILEPLLTSYTSSVSSASMEELRRTAYLWIDQHCSLIDLRPAVSNKLKYLSMKTDILSDPPSTLQEEVNKAVKHNNGQHPNLHGT